MNEVQLWLEQASAIPGVLACAVRRPDQSVAAKSSHPEFAVAEVEALLHDLSETIRSLQVHQITTERLRWAFANVWLRAARRADGAVALLILARQMECSPEVENILTLFQSQPA
jgi:hypothetical protein